MELIFLFIENFRNLENAALNFSFDTKVSYNLEENQLSINPDEGALKNFFGDGISNVSSIIGRNSAGKSNILELICYLTKGGGSRADKYIMIFKVTHSSRLTEYECYTNIPEVKADTQRFKIINDQKPVRDLAVLFFSNINDGRDQNFPKEVIDLSQNRRLRPVERKSDYHNQLRFMLSDYFDDLKFEPPKGLIFSVRNNVKNNAHYGQLQHDFPELSKDVMRHIRRRSYGVEGQQLKFGFRSILLIYLLSATNRRHRSPYEVEENSELNAVDEELVAKRLLSVHLNAEGLDPTAIHQRIGDFIQALFGILPQIGKITANDARSLLTFDRMVDKTLPELIREKLSGKLNYIIPFTRQNQRTLKDFVPIFEHPELIDIQWSGISSGQQAFLNLFAQLHSVIRRVSQQENVLLCIDEGDLYLHPQWQKDFLTRLVGYIPLIFKKQHIQLILTSHSPFLATDLPRQNLILLDRNVNGKSRVVSESDSLLRSFGANLYDLYEGSFFLDNGALSDFALTKIRQAITIASNKDANKDEREQALKISELIGEDMIRIKLKKMLGYAED